MANESKELFSQTKEEKKLLAFYTELLHGQPQPSIAYQKKFLLQLINTKIAQLEPKTDRIKFLHYALRIGAMVLSGIATVFLGLKFGGEPAFLGIRLNAANISNIVLIITALVTIITGLAVFWDTENYWIRNKIMLNKLKEIRYEYVFFLAGDQQIDPRAEDLKNHNGQLKIYLDKFIASLGDEYWEKFLKDLHKNNQ